VTPIDQKNPVEGRDFEAARQVLTFGLGNESYGVDILSVQEIRGWSPVIRLPKTPPHVLGVLNLRGSIVPIVDLRIRFGLEAEFTAVTVIIVLSIGATRARRVVGVVVDWVADVIDIQRRDIKPPPDLGTESRNDFIQGFATVAERMVILLDVDELIRRDLQVVQAASLAGAA
jgi:purine-binding chemotaxis protein CheW